MFCGMCGRENPPGAGFCVHCGARLAAPPAFAPQPPPAFHAPPPAAPAPARLGDRFLALILDTVIIAAMFAVAGMWIARRLGGVTAEGFSLTGSPALAAMAATLVAAFLYYWIAEALFGATLGKALMGLRVVRKDGRPCGFTPALLRNLLRIVDGIGVYLVGFIAALVSKSRQRVGDMAAGTLVVETGAGAAVRVSLAVLWLAMVAGGVVGAYLLHRGEAARPVQTAATEPGAPEPLGVSLRTTGRIKIVSFQFRQSREGPPRPPGPYKTSETVFASYKTVDYSTGDGGRPNLTFEVAGYDPDGLPLHTPWKGEFSGRVEADSPVDGNFKLDMPDYVTPGVCRLVVKVRDLIANQEAELTAPFRVEAEAIPPASGLELRGFRLSLARDGEPAETPVLGGSGTVYMKCYVHGLEFRGDEVDMTMALRVVDPAGKTVLDQPNFASVRDSYAYHPPSFRIALNGHVSLPSGAAKGPYREIYTLTDNVSGRRLVHEAQFEVR